MKKQDRNYRLLAIFECEYARRVISRGFGIRIRKCLMRSKIGVASPNEKEEKTDAFERSEHETRAYRKRDGNRRLRSG